MGAHTNIGCSVLLACFSSFTLANNHSQEPIDFCTQNGPIAPLYGDKRHQVEEIRSQIGWVRAILENDRQSSDAYRSSTKNQWDNESIRLDFEQRRECFEHWREGMESLRSAIESTPEGYF